MSGNGRLDDLLAEDLLGVLSVVRRSGRRTMGLSFLEEVGLAMMRTGSSTASSPFESGLDKPLVSIDPSRPGRRRDRGDLGTSRLGNVCGPDVREVIKVTFSME